MLTLYVKLHILSLANAPLAGLSLSFFSLTGFIPLGVLLLAFSLAGLRPSVLLSDSTVEHNARPKATLSLTALGLIDHAKTAVDDDPQC
jgi:hypothetical protein